MVSWRSLRIDRSYRPTLLRAAGMALGLAALISICVSSFSGCGSDGNSESAPAECAVTLARPNGGEVWTAGDSATVLWTSTGTCGDSVRIHLLQDGDSCLALASATADDGSWRWLVAGCRAGSTGYAVEVTDLESGRADRSDSTFTIRAAEAVPCVPLVLAPNGGESWQAGQSVSLRWSYSGSCGAWLDLYLLRNGMPCDTIARVAADAGSYRWTCTQCGGATGGYALRVQDAASGNFDDSDAPFDIAAAPEPCQLTLLQPNGGTDHTLGDAVSIAWTATPNCADSVRLTLERNGTVCDTIARSTDNDGIHTWSAAGCDTFTSGYRIRVSELSGSGTDASDSAFGIVPEPAECELALLAPNGGEAYTEGDPMTLSWNASEACGGQVRLELWRAGAVCDTIVASTDNDGAHAWNAVRCASASDGYQIRVVALETGDGDLSDAAFTIAPSPVCTLQLLAPNGGGFYCADGELEIEWDASAACGDQVRIELLRMGSPCDTIAATAANNGSFNWTVARCGAESDGYKIRVTDLDAGVSDQSDGSFGVFSDCALAWESPTGGEVYCVGDAVALGWSQGPCCASTVRIELLLSGTVCDTLFAAAANDGAESWAAARCGGASGPYRLRLVDEATGANATSSGTFQIFDCSVECDLAVTMPNGGEALPLGEAALLTWTAAAVCGEEVRIELLHLGAACDTLAAATLNDGSFEWTAARCGADSSDYAIRVTDLDSGVSDTSDGTFSIPTPVAPCEITVTYPTAGDSLCVGAGPAVTWTTSGDCGEWVKIELLRDGAVCATIDGTTLNDGERGWLVAQCDGERDGYQVRVTDLDGGSSGQSGAFTILPGCSLEFTSPVGGESLCPGQSLAVSWDASACCGDSLSLRLFRNDSFCLMIDPALPNTGDYSWNVVSCAAQTEGYTLVLHDETTGTTTTSAAFTIEDCEVALLAPAGGETYCIGDPVTIEWELLGCCDDSVRLELLRQGVVCDTIALATENDASYTWTAAQCAGAAPGYRVRVVNPSTGQFDDSDGPFTIHPSCAVSLIYPNGGEALCEGSSATLAWNSGACCGEEVTIELLRTGLVCATIADPTENDGSFEWDVARCGVETSNYRIRITESGSDFVAESAADFSIEPPCEVIVSSPSGGEFYSLGEAVTLTWTRSACCGNEVSLELVRDGSVCHEISAATDNDGEFIWNALQCAGETDDYKVRVTDLDSGATDESHAFQILAANALVVCGDGSGDHTTIQDAINAAGDGWTIFLCDGTHSGPGNRGLDFDGRDMTLRSLSGDPEACIIDCDGSIVDPHRVAYIQAGETVSIRDLTLTDGQAVSFGGALRVAGGSQVTLTNCHVTASGCGSWGGGVYVSGNSVLVCEACRFEENSAPYGAGLGCSSSDVTLADCTIASNWATAGGGAYISSCTADLDDTQFSQNVALQGAGLMLTHSDPPVTNCTFSENQATTPIAAPRFARGALPPEAPEPLGTDADEHGGGVLVWDSQATFTGCQFESNGAATSGAGLACFEASSPTLSDCDFTTNEALYGGGGVFADTDCNPSFTSCDFSENTAEIGGALYHGESGPSLTDCTFTANVAAASGGAIYTILSPSLSCTNCLFEQNSAESAGAVLAFISDAEYIGCTFRGNSAATIGGAAVASISMNAILYEDCDFEDNVAMSAGGLLAQAGEVTVDRCNFTENSGGYPLARPAVRAPNWAAGASRYALPAEPPQRSFPDLVGGGMVCDGANVEVLTSDFHMNVATYGGGFYAAGGEPIFNNVEFSENSAVNGGGIYSSGTELSIEDCSFTYNLADSCGAGLALYAGAAAGVAETQFQGNAATHYGGGICSRDVSPTSIWFTDFYSNSAGQGGALYADNDSDPAFVACTIAENSATDRGAGLCCTDGSAPGLLACTLRDNTCGSTGGAIFASYSSSPTLTSCSVSGNSATYGAGLHSIYESDPQLSGVIFYQNVALSQGGVLYLYSASDATLGTCRLCENSAGSRGSAASVLSGSSVTLTECILSHAASGAPVYCDGTSSATAACSDVYGNADGDYVEGLSGQLGIDGNISLDPLYCDRPAGDLDLEALSPCCTAGCGTMGAGSCGCD